MEIALAKKKSEGNNEENDNEENENEEDEDEENENEEDENEENENEENEDEENEDEEHQERKREKRDGDKSGSIKLNAKGSLNETESENLKNIKIKIHGTLKKPIMAMNLLDLMDDLQKLRDNPEDYLSPTPIYYSCFPLSGFLNREAIDFEDDLENDQLRDVYKLKDDFQAQFKGTILSGFCFCDL